MAKQRYYLDTRVLTAFFFAAMPFVAFGSFVVVNMAKTQLRESVGLSLEQRAVETKLALEQYVADQLVHLRLLALEPPVIQALASPAKPLPSDEVRRLELAWGGSQDPKLATAVLDSPVAARLKAMAQIRPVMKAIQVVDTQGRVRGVQGLRVVDASIFPVVPCANTNFPTLMAAEKIAETMLSSS